MSGISFLLVQRDGGPAIWKTCQHIAAVLRPGDDVVVIDYGSTDGSDMLLVRFGADGHWPRGQRPEPVRLDGVSQPEALAAAHARAQSPARIVLGPHDLVQPEGMAALRAGIAAKADCLVVNSDWHLGHGLGRITRPDADRWPKASGPLRPHESGGIAFDPARVLSAPAGLRIADDGLADGREMLAAARKPWAVVAPVISHPLPERMAPALPAPDIVAALPSQDRPLALRKMRDRLCLVHPDQVEAVLDAIAALHDALAVEDRVAAQADLPLLGILQAEGRGGARAALGVEMARRERMAVEALARGVGTLRRDLDVALPGPEYLRALYARSAPV